jgi:Xaa-Pro dipeptidase
MTLRTSSQHHTVDAAHPRRIPFSDAEYRARLASTQEAMRRAGLDCLLVHTPENICYLTGYETTGYFEYQVLVVPPEGMPALLVRNVERLNVDEYSWLPGAHIWEDGADYLGMTRRLVDQLASGPRVGLERHSWFVTAQLADALVDRLAAFDVVDTSRIVERLRLIKSPAEVACIRDAARLADIAMTAAIDAAREGGNELEVAAAAHAAQISAGSEYPALPHYVASGYRTELGHAHWTAKTLVAGELLKLEFLGVRRRYHAGLTRPAVIGHPTPQARADAELCIALQDRTFADIRPGAVVDDIVRRARAALVEAGRPAFRVRLGYSMGIGFPPIAGEGQTADFREGATWTLRPGMVFHMLSVMRVGLVISDTVVITETGCERLTQTARQLFVVET